MSSDAAPRVLVLGASGVLGQRILNLSRRLIPEARVVGAARRIPAGETAGETFVAVDIHDAEGLARELTGCAVAINVVGPYSYGPEPLIELCGAAGCDVVDIADDVEFLRRSARAAAEERRIRIVSGCSTIPAMVECLATRLADDSRIVRLEVRLAMGTRNPSSAALLFSLLRPLGGRTASGERHFGKLRWREHPGAVWRLYGRYPASFDSDGVASGARTLPATLQIACDQGLAMRALQLGAPFFGMLSDSWLMRLCRIALPAATVMSWVGGRLGLLLVEGVDDRDRVVESVEVRALREGLNVPSLPSVWAAARLLRNRATPSPGARRLAEFMSAQEVEDELHSAGYEVSWIRR